MRIVERRRVYTSVLLITAMMLFARGAYAQLTGIPCNTITTPNSVPQKFASPVDFFSGGGLLLGVTCSGPTVTAHVGSLSGTQYIYKYGYQRVNGAWKQIQFTGSDMAGPWVVGAGSATLSPIPQGTEGTVLAYVCQYIQSSWKCGCSDHQCTAPRWQIQGYKQPNDASRQATEGDGLVYITHASSNFALPNQTVTIIGYGFEQKPIYTVLWNGRSIQSKLTAKNANELVITVPNLTPGKYTLDVREGNTEASEGTIVWIHAQGGTKPTIHDVSPAVVIQDSLVTINGSGFSSTGNDIITTFGVIDGVPSRDGKTIQFRVSNFDEKVTFYSPDGKVQPVVWPYYMTVVNENGVSNSLSNSLMFK
jgi:hypothetical protein